MISALDRMEARRPISHRAGGVLRANVIDGRRLESLYRAHGRQVRRRAIRLLGNGHDGDDVMQQVFLRALGVRAHLPTAAAERGWLLRITTNLCLNRMRDGRRQTRKLRHQCAVADGVALPAGDTALAAGALMRAIPEGLRMAVLYYFVDGMSQRELSAMIRMPRRTLGYHLQRFRATARAAE